MKMIETTKFQILLNCLKLTGLDETTTGAIEVVPISFIPASSQDNVPNHPVLNQDNAPPNQDNTQRTRKRRSRSVLSDEFLENWIVSEKQCPNGRIDKFYTHKEHKFVCRSMKEVSRYDTDGTRPQCPKKTKLNREQTQTSQSLLVSIAMGRQADPSMPSTSAVPEDKPEGKKETEEMNCSNDESDIDLNDLVAFSQLIDVPKTIIDRFEGE
ncbi:hypothetical protein V6N11_057252 [Hibiscus sabdariffa]|uniref:MBD domain-containing protein n=2 Tax=Hibiscus sabdariffa TaxID=183260 RepID=A0ABR2B3Y4_9ROSI